VGAQRLAVGALVLFVGACSGGERPVELRVFAAASLTDAFTDLAAAFEVAHPEVSVQLNFAGSQTLRSQLELGAVADVFASADRTHFRTLQAAGRIGAPEVLAHNRLALVANPNSALRQFADLPQVARLVVGAADVPIGRYTSALLQGAQSVYGSHFAASVSRRVASRENSVRLLRSRVEMGAADAAIVYRSDRLPGLVDVPIPDALNPATDLVIGRLLDGSNPVLAQAFVDFSRRSIGQDLLVSHGFLAADQ
jgi:molybdate transport system substrate-binding protein